MLPDYDLGEEYAMEDQIYAYHAEMCQVFSHPKRLEVINILRDGEMSVGELAQKLELGQGNLSQHLSMMKERRILLSRKEGNVVYYRIANPKDDPLLRYDAGNAFRPNPAGCSLNWDQNPLSRRAHQVVSV